MTVLVLCQFAGELIARGAGLPLPGAVVGLALLLGILIVSNGPSANLRDTSDGLLRHLSLLFVPAGVGIVTELDAVERYWRPILVAILVSTVVSLAVTGWMMQRLLRDAGE